MSAQWKWVIGILSVMLVFALLACCIFFVWRYFFGGKPSVVITAPSSMNEALEGDEVTVEATATGRSIVRIELWVDDELMDTAMSPTPRTSSAPGSYGKPLALARTRWRRGPTMPGGNAASQQPSSS